MGRTRVRFTLRRLMTSIAVCAGALALLREAPVIALFLGPLIGSIWEVWRGKKGLIGGLVGGAITWACVGLVFLIVDRPGVPVHSITAEGIVFLVFAFVMHTIGGAAIGLVEGLAFWYLRYLATLPKQLRLRAERIARANSYRPGVAGIGGPQGRRPQESPGAVPKLADHPVALHPSRLPRSKSCECPSSESGP